MKKIGILTFHRSVNYGAVLQCYALQETIKRLGGNPEVIDYVDKEEVAKHKVFSFVHRKGIAPKLKTLVINLSNLPTAPARNRAFKLFLEKFIKLSAPAEVLSRSTAGGYDKIVVGSDQVWNFKITRGNEDYLLGWAPQDKRYSYAASFGPYIPDEREHKVYRRNISDFSGVSVREEDARGVLTDIGVERSDAVVSLDPTLLLSAEEWRKLGSAGTSGKTGYILVYCQRNIKVATETARRLAQETGLEVVNISLYAFGGYGKNVSKFGPEGFIDSFDKAKYVITDSFHGTVFSIIMKKLFIVNVTAKNGDKNTRSLNLLNKLDLNDRVLEGDVLKIKQDINWDQVGKKLDALREDSLDYLRGVVG